MQSKIKKFFDYFSILAILNIMWLLSSMLIITFPAATEALFFSVMAMLNSNEEIKIGSNFFGYIKRNLWSSLKRGILFFAGIIILIFDLLIVSQIMKETLWQNILFSLLIFLLITLLFVSNFQLLLLFTGETDFSTRIKQSFYLFISRPKYSIGLIVTIFVFILIISLNPLLFLVFGGSFPLFCIIVIFKKISEIDEKNN